MTSGARVVAYLRRSKPSGRTPQERAASELKEEASIIGQRRAIQYACDFNNWTIAGEEIDILSGRNMRRPGLQRALDVCDTSEVAALVVAKLDRLSRSCLDFELLMARATKRDWRIVVAEGNFDLSTAIGRYMARSVMNAAQLEPEQTSERTSAALQVKKSEGMTLGRPSRTGLVHELLRFLRSAGLTFQALADDLNSLEIPTAQNGDRWHSSTVAAILKAERVPA